jgi:hypothetical protein
VSAKQVLIEKALQKIDTVDERMKEKPFATRDFLDTIEFLESSLEQEKDPKQYLLPYIMSLIGDRIIELSIEDNYVPYRKMKEIYKTVIKNYKQLLTDSEKISLPEEFTKIFDSFREAHIETKKPTKKDRLKRYILTDTDNDLLKQNFKVKMYLAPMDGPYQISSWYYPYLLDLDANLSDPKIASNILDGFYELYKIAKKERGINKLCFIRKRKGPLGAVLTAGGLVEKTKNPSLFYTQRHFSTDSRLNGSLLEDNDEISIIYDLAVSGSGISNCGNFLLEEAKRQKLKNVKVNSAIVFCDYGRNAQDEISSSLKGAKLYSITKMPLKRYLEIRKPQFDEKMENLNKAYKNKDITFNEYDEQGSRIMYDFCDLAWADLVKQD